MGPCHRHMEPRVHGIHLSPAYILDTLLTTPFPKMYGFATGRQLFRPVPH